jgi:two-component system cell cycle sensor histidine kinase/response regulator CckA
VAAPKKQRESQGEAVRTNRGGNAIPAEVQLTATGNSQLACCARDILERERAENALRESEERYRLLFESIPQPTWVFDAETLSFLTVNEAAVRHYGYAREEFAAMTIKDIRPPGEVPALMAKLSYTPAGLAHDDTWKHRKKDGTEIYAETITRDIIFSGRRARLVLANDVTERMRAEERLHEQAELLDHAQEAILVRDLEGRVRFWNKSAERIYGWSAEEVRGMNADELLNQEPLSQLEEANRALSEKGEWMGELQQITKARETLLVESRWTLVRDNQNQSKSILVVNSDITERKRLEAQFLRVQRLESIGALAGGIAHDVNNILSPILLSVRMLQMRFADPESQRFLTILGENAKRGGEMIKQVLQFARGVEGQQILLQPLHLIDEVARMLRETLAKSIYVKTRMPNGVWSVIGDPTQLHQVLMNLCVNARDAMTGGGRLTLAAENVVIDESYARMNIDSRPGRYVLITVRDTGAGIPTEIIDRIFDPFFTTKETGSGTGLGLSTVMGIVKSHGGFISVSSQVGTGSEFKVYVPAAESLSKVPALNAEPETQRGHGELILVVDDEAAIREITRSTLEAAGYRVLTASDGTEAVVLFVQHQNDVKAVITDLVMPYMDGPASIRALRKLNPLVRIIVSTGVGERDKNNVVLDPSVNAILSKPYTADTLLNVLSEVLRPSE